MSKIVVCAEVKLSLHLYTEVKLNTHCILLRQTGWNLKSGIKSDTALIYRNKTDTGFEEHEYVHIVTLKTINKL